MSFLNNHPSKRGVPLSPGRRPLNNTSYLEKAREVSSKFDDLENKISVLEDECSSFRKAIDSGRKLIQEERKQIGIRARNIQRQVSTPQHPSPRSRAKDLIDYSDEMEPKEFLFETPHPNTRLSRTDRIMESTFSTASGVNRNSYTIGNNNSIRKKNHNSHSFTPKRDYSNININSSYNDDSSSSMSYSERSYDKSDRYSTSEFSQSSKRRLHTHHTKNSYSRQEISPVLSKSMEMYRKDEAVLNKQLKEMKIKILEFDERVSEAQKILSEPIYNIETEEKLVDDAERSLIKAQSRLNSFEENVIEDYDEMINNIEFIESQNNKRSKELNIKRKRLDEMRSLIQRRRDLIAQSRSLKKYHNKSYRNSSHNSKYRHSSNLPNEQALKKIDEGHEKLKQRSLSIQYEEESIDKYENELIQNRKQMEQEWKLKMKRIENLSSIKRDVDRLNINIHSEETEIEQLQNVLNDIRNEKLEMKKRISDSIAMQSRSLSKYSQNDDENISRINQKRRKIDSTTRKLNEKRRKNNKLEESVRKLIISLKLYTDQVEHLEAQVEEICQTTEEQLEDLQRETAQLSKSLTTIKSPPNERNSFQQNRSVDNTEEFGYYDDYD